MTKWIVWVDNGSTTRYFVNGATPLTEDKAAAHRFPSWEAAREFSLTAFRLGGPAARSHGIWEVPA